MEIIDNLEDEAAEVQKPEGMPPLRPDEPVPEEDFSMEDSVVILDEIYPPEMPAPPKKRIRPEWILAAIALLAAAALAWVAILCRPYYKAADDPEALVVRRHHEEMTEPPVSPEPETEPEETEPTSEPTIPPEPNPYGRLDFQYNRHNYLTCLRTDSYSGVDVSAFQGDIDWKKVARSGIDFAIIRLGYRGYGSGKLVEDEYAQKNLAGATEAGLPIGAYFFSQALSMDEADQEIEYMLNILGDYRLDMPIILDWEIPASDARTANMDARTLTDIQLYFCEKMKGLGYQPMVYFNWHQSENLYYLSELEDFPFWLALYQDRMRYPWKVEMWQYTCTGRVPGINGDVDINVYMP